MIADKIKLRLARWADVDAVAKLIYDVCEADGDVTVALTPQELKHQWHSEGFDPERLETWYCFAFEWNNLAKIETLPW